jgi:hypothetical protein
MPGCGMNYLMTKDRGKFCLIFQLGQQTAVYSYFPTRQGPGIGGGIVQYNKLVWQLPISHTCHTIANFADILGEARINCVFTTLHLPAWYIVLRTDSDFLRLGNKGQLPVTGDWIDSTTA